MNILFYYPGFVNTDSCLAGTNRMIFTVAKHLAKSNDVVVTSSRASRVEMTDKVCILPCPENDAVRSHNFSAFDVVVFSCGDTHLRSEKPAGQKWIRWEHCWDFPRSEWSDKIDMVVGVSKLHAEHLIESGLPAGKVRYIPNCVDLDIFYDWGAQRDPRGIMFCGALVEGKGLHILIETVRRLGGYGAGIGIEVFGSSDMTGSSSGYEQEALRSLWDLPFIFHNAVSKEELAVAYSRNSLLVLPTELESFGLVLAEAQACGCIPVVHRCGGVEAIVNDGVTGYLYSPNTSETLSEVIARVLGYASLDVMRGMCVATAKEKYAPPRTFEAADKIFREVLN